MRISARLEVGDFSGPFADYRRFAEQRMERAALIAVDRGRSIAEGKVRADMAGAGLAGLGRAIGSTSDEKRGRGVFRRPGGGFSASGVVFVRSRSERTVGAIEAYTQGAEIRPIRSRWLWIPTDEIPRVTGRFRMTPALYVKNGFETKIGPLVRIRAANGNPLLIVRNVGVSALGARRKAKSLTRRGRPRKGQVQQEFIVAFIGIPRTSRAARIDVAAIMREVAGQLPELFKQALGRV